MSEKKFKVGDKVMAQGKVVKVLGEDFYRIEFPWIRTDLYDDEFELANDSGEKSE